MSHPRLNPPHHERLCTRANQPLLVTREHQKFVTENQLGVNNTIVKHTRCCTISPSEEMEKYQVCDFSLENLQAIGANLTPTHLTNYNATDTIDMAVSTLSSLDNIDFQP